MDEEVFNIGIRKFLKKVGRIARLLSPMATVAYCPRRRRSFLVRKQRCSLTAPTPAG